MVTEKKIGLIGCGAMGSAVIRGILNKNITDSTGVWVYDKFRQKAEELKKDFPLNIASDYSELCQNSDIIFIAVKPADFKVLFSEINSLINKKHLIVSMAAGLTTGYIEGLLQDGNRVVRLMPNTPCLIGEGVVALSPGKDALPSDVEFIESLLGSLGQTVTLDEKYMDAVTALSGSGPAYVYLFLEAMSDAGVSLGLDRATASSMAAQTLAGAARLAQVSGKSFTELKNLVTSPGGTTIAALKVLEEKAFRGTVINAVEEAARRAKELEGK